MLSRPIRQNLSLAVIFVLFIYLILSDSGQSPGKAIQSSLPLSERGQNQLEVDTPPLSVSHRMTNDPAIYNNAQPGLVPPEPQAGSSNTAINIPTNTPDPITTIPVSEQIHLNFEDLAQMQSAITELLLRLPPVSESDIPEPVYLRDSGIAKPQLDIYNIDQNAEIISINGHPVGSLQGEGIAGSIIMGGPTELQLWQNNTLVKMTFNVY